MAYNSEEHVRGEFIDAVDVHNDELVIDILNAFPEVTRELSDRGHVAILAYPLVIEYMKEFLGEEEAKRQLQKAITYVVADDIENEPLYYLAGSAKVLHNLEKAGLSPEGIDAALVDLSTRTAQALQECPHEVFAGFKDAVPVLYARIPQALENILNEMQPRERYGRPDQEQKDIKNSLLAQLNELKTRVIGTEIDDATAKLWDSYINKSNRL